MPEDPTGTPPPDPPQRPAHSPGLGVQNTYGPSYTQVGDHNTQVISSVLAPPLSRSERLRKPPVRAASGRVLGALRPQRLG